MRLYDLYQTNWKLGDIRSALVEQMRAFRPAARDTAAKCRRLVDAGRYFEIIEGIVTAK